MRSGLAPLTAGLKTLTAMAARLQVAQSTLCRWESGERKPQGDYLVRVEGVLRAFNVEFTPDGRQESPLIPARSARPR
jgi:transcriptional regulator with XRE-family HTH domain